MASLSEEEKKALKKKLKSTLGNPELLRWVREIARADEELRAQKSEILRQAQEEIRALPDPYAEHKRRAREGWRAFEDTMERIFNPPRLPIYDELEANLREAHRKAETEGPLVFFPTPPDATWDDVCIRFKDGHTVSIKVKSRTGVYTYADMGMADKRSGKPNLQWELLGTFAEERGILDWSSTHADRRNQKRREYLAAILRRFFDIEGDPFRLTRDRKGWEARFLILPDE